MSMDQYANSNHHTVLIFLEKIYDKLVDLKAQSRSRESMLTRPRKTGNREHISSIDSHRGGCAR